MTELRRAFAIILILLVLFFWFGLALGLDDNRQNQFDTPIEQTLAFDVFIGKKNIGHHFFSIIQGKKKTIVQSRALFDYRIFNVSVYKYKHYSSEIFDSNLCLTELDSSTESQIKIRGSLFQTVSGRRQEDGFKVTGSNDQLIAVNCMMPFAYWAPEILRQSSLLNAQSGKEIRISVTKLVGSHLGKRYLLQGEDLDIEVQYSSKGDWVALSSRIGNGRILSYVKYEEE